MYITIEGIDTAGKSSQIELLKDKYRNSIITKEPYSNDIRSLILEKGLESKKAELLLFLADRSEHIQKVIKPNLDKLIFSDRSLISGIAYALMQGFKLNFLIDMNLFVTDSLLPQKVILLWLDLEILEFRLKDKRQDKIESRGIEYLFNVQCKMLDIIRELDIEHRVINASKSIEEINLEIIDFLRI